VLAGREDLLAELGARFVDAPAWPEPRMVVLSGLGGAGKTSVAVEYAHRHIAEVRVCWQFAAEDPATLEAEFAELAAQLGAREPVDVRDPVASVHGVLARQEARWLLVFDNVTDRRALERFVPPAGNGQILVTTQNQHWPLGQLLDVPCLDVDVAAGFLVSRTGEADWPAARNLAAELGGLPLALEQAAAYMQAGRTSLGRYLALFQARRLELLARGEAAGHPLNVAATLSLGVSRLTEDAPGAVGLLRLLAFLVPEPVPLRLLLGDSEECDPVVVATVGSVMGDPLAVTDAIAALRRYSLVTPAGDGLVLVHRLVQAIIRGQLAPDQGSQWRETAATLVEAAVSGDPLLPASWLACAMLLPHARAVLDLTSTGMWQIAQSLGWSGNYLAARDLFRQITTALQEHDACGPRHHDTLTARYCLAEWTGRAGDAPGAREQFAALLPTDELVLGADHPDTLSTCGNLATWTGMVGDAAGARDQSATLLQLRQRVLGADHPDTLTTRINLATWTGQAGDATGAKDQLTALQPIIEQALGPEHPDTLTTRINLATWTGEAGDATGARDQLTALLPIVGRAMGARHPNTLTTCINLATWTGEAGDATDARDQFAALLPVCERALGADHRDTLTICINVAQWTGQAGDPVAARNQYAALLPIIGLALGADHPDTLTARSNLKHWTEQARRVAAKGRSGRSRHRFWLAGR
jgi:hypothetical protein